MDRRGAHRHTRDESDWGDAAGRGASEASGAWGGGGLPVGWARRPPPGWVLCGGWGRARWADLPREVRLRLWRLATLPAGDADAN